jgi:hypothetical protein
MDKEFVFPFWAPLLNFEMEDTKVELSGDIAIRELTDYELKPPNILVQRWPGLRYDKFAIECSIRKPDPEPEPGFYLIDGRKWIEKVLSILRLFKEEVVGFNLIVQPLCSAPNYGMTSQHLRHYQLWLPEQFSERYRLVKNEMGGFQAFFTDFWKTDFQRFTLAVDYFNKSYIEPYVRDSLLDLVICLENLYLRNEDPELKGYKLRLRASYILSTGFEEREKIFKDLKQAYDLRSEIVHGNKMPVVDYPFLFKIRGYARESIKKFLKTPSFANSNVLDEIVLKG